MAESRPPRRAAARIALQNLDVNLSDESEDEPAFFASSSSEDKDTNVAMMDSPPHEWLFVDAEQDSLSSPAADFLGLSGVNPHINMPENPEDIVFFFPLSSTMIFSQKWSIGLTRGQNSSFKRA